MQYKKRSLGFTFAILCTFTLLLTACRSDSSSETHTIQHTARLSLHLTPSALSTTTPALTTPGTNATIPAQYVGQVPSENAWVGIATTSKRMVAFITDGTKGHPPTFAQWFRGSVDNNILDATAPAKNGSDRLQGTLNKSTATGTVTMANGKSLAFTVNAVPAGDPAAGLYRSEHTVNNQRYIAGWIVLPTTGAVGTATPAATEASTPSTGEGTPPQLVGTLTPTLTETATPSATETASPSTTGTLQQGAAIVDEQNQKILPVPPLTQAQINAKQVSIPNMAIFKVVPCQQNLC